MPSSSQRQLTILCLTCKPSALVSTLAQRANIEPLTHSERVDDLNHGPRLLFYLRSVYQPTHGQPSFRPLLQRLSRQPGSPLFLGVLCHVELFQHGTNTVSLGKGPTSNLSSTSDLLRLDLEVTARFSLASDRTGLITRGLADQTFELLSAGNVRATRIAVVLSISGPKT